MQLSGVGCGQTHAVTISHLHVISHFHPASPVFVFFVAPQTILFPPVLSSQFPTPHSKSCTASQSMSNRADSAPGAGEQLLLCHSGRAPRSAGVSTGQHSRGREGERATPALMLFLGSPLLLHPPTQPLPAPCWGTLGMLGPAGCPRCHCPPLVFLVSGQSKCPRQGLTSPHLQEQHTSLPRRAGLQPGDTEAPRPPRHHHTGSRC